MDPYEFHHPSLESSAALPSGTRGGGSPADKTDGTNGFMHVTQADLQSFRDSASMDLQQLFPSNGSVHYLPHQASISSMGLEEDVSGSMMYQPTQSNSMQYPSPISGSSGFAMASLLRSQDTPEIQGECLQRPSEDPCTVQSLLQTEQNNADMLSVLSALSSSSSVPNQPPSELQFSAPSDRDLLTRTPPAIGSDHTDFVKPSGKKTARNSPVHRKLCNVEGCQSQARAFSRCKKHGGTKRCSHPGCTKSVQSRGLCIRHGGGSRCQETGCTRASQSQGLCKMHGGGRLCTVPDCGKKAHLKRLCRRHGGGSKCTVDGCDKWAQRQGFCMTHSKEIMMRKEELVDDECVV